MLWSIPQCWTNEDVFIIGGGPSVAGLPLEKLHGKKVLAINNAVDLGPWEFGYFMDFNWFVDHPELIRSFRGDFITVAGQLKEHPWIKVVKRGETQGFSKSPHEISPSTNSGYGAINIAYLMGARRIFLLGYDMRRVGGHHNYHDNNPRANPDHPDAIPDNIYEDDFIKRFERLVPQLPPQLQIFNATPDSALKVFPIIDPLELLNEGSLRLAT